MHNATHKTNADVIEIISRVTGKEHHEITLEKAVESLCRDSIQLFEVVLVFEKEYNTQVQYEDLMSIETVGDIVEYITSRSLQRTAVAA